MKIYTATIAPASIRNSAEVADGMFPIFMNPQRFDLFGGAPCSVESRNAYARSKLARTAE
jgi:hypothetical protein